MFQSAVLVTILSLSLQFARSSPTPPPVKIFDVNRSAAPSTQPVHLGELSLTNGRTGIPEARQASVVNIAHESIQAYQAAQHNFNNARLIAQINARNRVVPSFGHLAYTQGRTVSKADRQAPSVIAAQQSIKAYRQAQAKLKKANNLEDARIAGGQPVYAIRVQSGMPAPPPAMKKALAQSRVFTSQNQKNLIKGGNFNVVDSSKRLTELKLNDNRASSSESVGENNFHRPTVRRLGYQGEPPKYFLSTGNVVKSETSAFQVGSKRPQFEAANLGIDLRAQKKPRIMESAESSSVKPSLTPAEPFPVAQGATKNLLSNLPKETISTWHQSKPMDVDTSLTLSRPERQAVYESKQNQDVDTNLSL